MPEEKIKDAELVENDVPTSSPIPPKINEKKVNKEKMNFYDALRRVMEDKKITREDWGDTEYYGVMKDSLLKLHKPDGKFYDWIINDGDIEGEDWVTL